MTNDPMNKLHRPFIDNPLPDIEQPGAAVLAGIDPVPPDQLTPDEQEIVIEALRDIELWQKLFALRRHEPGAGYKRVATVLGIPWWRSRDMLARATGMRKPLNRRRGA